MTRQRLRARLAAPAFALLLASCATTPAKLPSIAAAQTVPDRVELASVPFHSQRAYQCGPAALAMTLNHAGVEASPDELVSEVYLPKRKGSLQLDLIASARRHGVLPYVIEPNLAGLMAELNAGRPVLVLQNLGWKRWPVWHYAVAIGYDAGKDNIILRSGHTRRKLMSARAFDAKWSPSERWGLILLRPGELPALASEQRYFQAVSALEPQLAAGARAVLYESALKQWPDSATAAFGLSLARYSQGDPAGAEELLRRLIKKHPGHVAAHNNLAYLLASRGCFSEASALIDRAGRLPDAATWSAELGQTETEIERGQRDSEAPNCDAGHRSQDSAKRGDAK